METLRHIVAWVATSLLGIIAADFLLAITENFKELLKQRRTNTLLVRLLDTIPQNWQDKLRWHRLRGLWWLWSIFGLSAGVALAVWLLPFAQPNHEQSDLTQRLDKIKQEGDSKSNELERDSKSNELWDVIAFVENKDGTILRLEVDRAKSLQECKNRAMVAYAHLPNGPIFCQHVTHVELIDVYGNARPVQ